MREISSHRESQISKLSSTSAQDIITIGGTIGTGTSWDEEQFTKSSKENFITENNLKVKVLDGNLFKSFSPNSQVVDPKAVVRCFSRVSNQN